MERVRLKFGGLNPIELEGSTIKPGQVLLEGALVDGLMIPDVVLALRHGGIHLVPIEPQAPAKVRQPAKV